jgi:uncharacterized beta-barrel protein YwiB (DUF1934 family)
MALARNVERTKSGKLKYRGETFSGFNKPKRQVKGTKKKVVLAKKGDQVKMVRFGDANMKNRSNEPARKRNFRARHNCDTAKDKFTARYWSCKDW